jgi:thymidine kinase
MKTNPSFHVYCGPMFSSKTSRLLMELERYKYQHVHVVVFKPQIDTRYSISEVITHGGWRHSAVCVQDGSDVLKYLAEIDVDPSVIAVDEAFMIPGIAEALVFLYQSGFNVVVSTLDMASNGKPFPEVVQMLPWATKIEKCTAVCTVCGDDAFFTHKKTTGGSELVVEVGGDELYEPRCAAHFPTVFNHNLKK